MYIIFEARNDKIYPATYVYEFTGAFYAVSNVIGTVAGIFSPIITGYIIGNTKLEDVSIAEMEWKWMQVFVLNLIISLIGCLTFVIVGTTKRIVVKQN